MSTSGHVSVIDKAISLHQAGDLEKADKLYARFLKKKPKNPQALHMRGVLKLQQSQYQLAEHLLQKALVADRSDPWIHFHLAQVLAKTDRHKQAAAQFILAIDGGAEDADVHYMYANTLFELQQFPKAITHYEVALNKQPDDPDCRLNMANALEAAGELSQAIDCLEPLTQAADAPVPLKLQLAELLLSAKKAIKAHSVILSIPSISLTEVDQALSVAKLLYQQMRHESAEHLLTLALVNSSALQANQWDLCIGLLNDLGHYAEAQDRLEKRLPAMERSAWSWFQQGIGLQVLGEFDQAAKCHQRALDIDETLGLAAYSLASNGSVSIEHRWLKKWIEYADGIDELNDTNRAQFAFAAAWTLDKQNQTDKAFERYLQANALVSKSQPFNADDWDHYIDQIIDTFSAEFFQQYNDDDEPGSLSDQHLGEGLHFIVGMPRSGSTLLEQILIKNTPITGLGEHHAMRCVFIDIPEVTHSLNSMPQCALELKEKEIQRLRQYYLGTLPSTDPSVWYVDKMLGNFIRLGVLALIFPKAKILNSARDPMATSVSCFINTFSSGLNFTYDLYAMGRAWRSYQRLMRHWHEVLPLKMMDVHYEQLVSAPETYQQKILQFLELPNTESEPFIEGAEQTGLNKVINTASFWQARQPVTTTSVEAWKRFDAYLDPLREGLAYKHQ